MGGHRADDDVTRGRDRRAPTFSTIHWKIRLYTSLATASRLFSASPPFRLRTCLVVCPAGQTIVGRRRTNGGGRGGQGLTKRLGAGRCHPHGDCRERWRCMETGRGGEGIPKKGVKCICPSGAGGGKRGGWLMEHHVSAVARIRKAQEASRGVDTHMQDRCQVQNRCKNEKKRKEMRGRKKKGGRGKEHEEEGKREKRREGGGGRGENEKRRKYGQNQTKIRTIHAPQRSGPYHAGATKPFMSSSKYREKPLNHTRWHDETVSSASYHPTPGNIVWTGVERIAIPVSSRNKSASLGSDMDWDYKVANRQPAIVASRSPRSIPIERAPIFSRTSRVFTSP